MHKVVTSEHRVNIVLVKLWFAKFDKLADSDLVSFFIGIMPLLLVNIGDFQGRAIGKRVGVEESRWYNSFSFYNLIEHDGLCHFDRIRLEFSNIRFELWRQVSALMTWLVSGKLQSSQPELYRISTFQICKKLKLFVNLNILLRWTVCLLERKRKNFLKASLKKRNHETQIVRYAFLHIFRSAGSGFCFISSTIVAKFECMTFSDMHSKHLCFFGAYSDQCSVKRVTMPEITKPCHWREFYGFFSGTHVARQNFWQWLLSSPRAIYSRKKDAWRVCSCMSWYCSLERKNMNSSRKIECARDIA